MTVENGPDWWLDAFPWPALESHKYRRGHALVAGGAVMTGAARLAARAAARLGAGLVTVAAPEAALPIYAAALTGVIVQPVADDRRRSAEFLADKRRNAALIGPGAGVGGETREKTLAILGAGKRAVLDADALTVFADDPDTLFSAIRSPCVMTPHDGEFARLFDTAGRQARARAPRGAAERCGGAAQGCRHRDRRARRAGRDQRQRAARSWRRRAAAMCSPGSCSGCSPRAWSRSRRPRRRPGSTARPPAASGPASSPRI